MSSPIPIIKLEIERMQYAIYTALSQYQLEMDSMLKESIEKYCTDENLRIIISATVRQVVDKTVKEEIENFFNYSGDGRHIIAEEVRAKLLRDFKVKEDE